VVKNVRLPILTERDETVVFNTANRHVVIRATLPSGDQVALDPTGAQFGWSEIISPWATYATSRIQQMTSEAIGPGFRPLHPDVAADKCYATVLECWRDAIQRVTLTIQDCLHQLGPSGLMTMLNWPTPSFNEFANLMVGDGRSQIKTIAREYEQGPLLKLYRDAKFRAGITSSEEGYEFLKNVWFTDEEFDQHSSGGVLQLESIWRARLDTATASSQAHSDFDTFWDGRGDRRPTMPVWIEQLQAIWGESGILHRGRKGESLSIAGGSTLRISSGESWLLTVTLGGQ
jgi:hypothetical protein